MIYLKLFLSFFQIWLFSFGGGYAAMPLIQNQVVDLHHWLTMQEFADIITISQMTPGPIAINSATFVGIHIAGLLGAVVATLGCIAPSCIIVLLIAHFYYKYRDLTAIRGILQGLRPAVVALIASAGMSILLMALWGNAVALGFSNLNLFAVLLFAVCFFVLRKFKLNPILVMVGAGMVNLAVHFLAPLFK